MIKKYKQLTNISSTSNGDYKISQLFPNIYDKVEVRIRNTELFDGLDHVYQMVKNLEKSIDQYYKT